MWRFDGAMILRSSQWPLPYPEAQAEFFERRINGHGENMVNTLGENGKTMAKSRKHGWDSTLQICFFD
jgi:hypothetical protein